MACSGTALPLPLYIYKLLWAIRKVDVINASYCKTRSKDMQTHAHACTNTQTHTQTKNHIHHLETRLSLGSISRNMAICKICELYANVMPFKKNICLWIKFYGWLLVYISWNINALQLEIKMYFCTIIESRNGAEQVYVVETTCT
jgi:hypothetical protein